MPAVPVFLHMYGEYNRTKKSIGICVYSSVPLYVGESHKKEQKIHAVCDLPRDNETKLNSMHTPGWTPCLPCAASLSFHLCCTHNNHRRSLHRSRTHLGRLDVYMTVLGRPHEVTHPAVLPRWLNARGISLLASKYL